MTEPRELPQLTSELIDMSKEYLRQETVEPAKRLGRYAGLGIAAGFIAAVAALFLTLAAYAALKAILPEGEWWVVLARGLTVVLVGAAAGALGWRMTR